MWRRTQEPVYDAVIIGSGASGGIAAKVLVEAGLKVAMLEAGPLRKHLVDFAYQRPGLTTIRIAYSKRASPNGKR